MVAANALAPNRRQVIGNHHDELTVTSAPGVVLRCICITLPPQNKGHRQERSGGREPGVALHFVWNEIVANIGAMDHVPYV